MRINQLIKELREIRKQYGDVEVTCTGTSLNDGLSTSFPAPGIPDVFETTVENLIVTEDHPVHGTAVRLWLQVFSSGAWRNVKTHEKGLIVKDAASSPAAKSQYP